MFCPSVLLSIIYEITICWNLDDSLKVRFSKCIGGLLVQLDQAPHSHRKKKILVAPDDVLRASLASYQVFGSVRFVCVFMVDTECYVEHLEILKNN